MKASLFRSPRPLLVAGLAALTPSALTALDKTTNITWNGTTSNWLTPSNWSTSAIPGSGSRVSLGSTASKSLLLANTGTGDLSYTVGGFAITPSTGAYTLTLQGTSAGWLNLTVDDLGFYSVNNSNSDLAMGVVLDSYSRLSYTGSTGNTNTTRASGFWGAKITMLGNSELDVSKSTVSAVNVYSLNTAADTKVTIGANNLTINNASTLGGTMSSTRTTGEAIRTWADTTLTSTGVINLVGDSYILVRSGTFFVNGTLNGNIRTHSASSPKIGGTGTINGSVLVQSTGVLSAGANAAAGLLTINGNVTVSSGGSLAFEFLTTSSWDQLVINGGLDLSSGGAALSAGTSGTGFVVKDSRYKIITVNGSVSGDFSSFTSNFGVTADVDYELLPVSGGYEVWVDIDRLAFASVSGISANQTRVGALLDAAGSAVPDALVLALDAQLTSTAYGKVLNELSAQSYQSWFASAAVQTASFGSAIENRLSIPDTTYRSVRKFDTFAQVSHAESSVAGGANNDYYSFRPDEVIVGGDYALSPSLLVGASFAHNSTDYTLDDSGSTGDSTSSTFGLYGRYRRGALQATGIAFYGLDDYSAQRSVADTDLGTYAVGESKATRYGARAQIGYTFKPAWLEVTPTVGLQYLTWTADAFKETGDAGLAALAVAEQEADSLLASAGVQLARTFTILDGRAQIRPFLTVFGQFEALDDTRDLTSTVLGQTVTVQSAQPADLGLRLEGGVTCEYDSGLALFASYGSDKSVVVDKTVALRAGVSYRF